MVSTLTGSTGAGTIACMASDFLTEAQVTGYGRFQGMPARSYLERYFFLDDEDRALVGKRRGDHNRLGFALQITTARFLGVFLEEPLDVPWPVVEHLAEQIGVDDPSCVKNYTQRSMTAFEHAWEIQEAYGFTSLDDEGTKGEFRRYLEDRAWVHAEGPAALFDHAAGWLRGHRVLLPGITVLSRLVLKARADVADRVCCLLAAAADGVDPMLPGRLLRSLKVPAGKRFSELERWKHSPTRVSGPALVSALGRAMELEALGARDADYSGVPSNRIAALARYGMASKAATLQGLAEPRRTGTLLALVRHLDAVAVDDVLDLFALLMSTRLINPARTAADSNRLASLPRLERASRLLALVNKELLVVLDAVAAGDAGLDAGVVWASLDRVASRAQILDAVTIVTELVPDDDGSAETATRVALAEKYRTVRPFLALLSGTGSLAASPAGEIILAAVKVLPELAGRRIRIKPLLPDEIDPSLVPHVWRRAVLCNPDLPAGTVDRDAYVVCVLEQLYKALRVRDVFATCSHRWGDPRAQLLEGAAWAEAQPRILGSLGLDTPVKTHLRSLVHTLDASWRQTADRLEEAGPDSLIGVVPGAEGRMRLSVERLDAVDIPASLVELRAVTAAMLPHIDLPDLLLEVHSWTGFLDAYVHVSGAGTRLRDLATTVAALLIAEGCNVGLVPVTDPAREALTRARLSHVDQNYVRAETHTAANSALIDAQSKVPIVQHWGGGLLASVDGLRFVVPVRTISSGPSPKYFGYKRGITWLNAVNDQVVGIGAQIVTGTPRDSLHILDVLLNLDGGPKPEIIATDEASYSDMVFGLFSMLGYRFSPRIADIGDTRYWRAQWPAEPVSDYGPLNAIARNKVNLSRVETHWPDMLRVVGSLVTHQVRAYDVLKMLGRDGRPTPLGQAFAEYGRIPKTLHLLAMIDPIDDTHRRGVNTQTTVQESRHRLARKVFHGKRGQIYQRYREGQEDQLGALGIVVNAITLWNTRYLNAAIEELRGQGLEIRDEDISRLSPLGHAHVNELGRYTFSTINTPTTLRPFRDPTQDTGEEPMKWVP